MLLVMRKEDIKEKKKKKGKRLQQSRDEAEEVLCG